MAFQFPARGYMSSTTTGTSTLTLAAPPDASRRSFQAAYGAGPVKILYCISGVALFEIGVGTFTSPTTLTRDTVIASSNGGALVNLPTGTVRVVATQRTNPRLGVFVLTPTAEGLVTVTMERDVRVPFTFMDQDLTIENEDDPLLDWNPQFEGLVVDKVTGLVYAGQEDVGIWQIDPVAGTASAAPRVTTRGSASSTFSAPDSVKPNDKLSVSSKRKGVTVRAPSRLPN